jgi:hypothetical protein
LERLLHRGHRELQWRSGESHENLSAGDADRYPFDGHSLHFGAKTAIQVAFAIAGSNPQSKQPRHIQGRASGKTPFPARTS